MSGTVDREHVLDWVDRYERAWRSSGTSSLRDLFTEDATYRNSPYEEPHHGLAAIAAMWEREREGPDEDFTIRSEVVAVDDHTAVVRLEVTYRKPLARGYRDLWVIGFDEDGRCRAFEEWPFWPGQPLAAPREG